MSTYSTSGNRSLNQAIITDRNGLGRAMAFDFPWLALGATRGSDDVDPVGDCWGSTTSAIDARVSSCQSKQLSAVSLGLVEFHFTIIVVIVIVYLGQLLKIDLVAKHTADATKAFDKLIAFAGAIGHEL